MPVNDNISTRWCGILNADAPAPGDVREAILAEYFQARRPTERNAAKILPPAIGARGATSDHPWRLVSCWVPSKTNPSPDVHFEIYRASEVSLTSTLRSGGDWRWRLRIEADRILASGSGFQTEQECVDAVEQLKHYALGAHIRRSPATV